MGSSAIAILAIAILGLAAVSRAAEPAAPAGDDPWQTGTFRWVSTPPLIAARRDDGDWHSLKDPSVVYHEGRWHLFCTVRGTQRSHAIVHLSFADWSQAGSARQRVLPCHGGFFCAPQIFYFTPHKRWYLICQASDPSWDPEYQVAYSTSQDIADPAMWTPLKPMFGRKPVESKAWLDFWVICDDAGIAHLFYTSLDGKLWRSQTRIADFPNHWSEPQLALEGDFFEASHTYHLRGPSPQYLTLIEAQNGHGWRYYKAYLASRLEGPWRPLAANRDQAFASLRNVEQPGERWTDAISHIELLRAGIDERLEIDPTNLRVVYQGVLDKDRAGKPYGQIPWKLGLLREAGRADVE